LGAQNTTHVGYLSKYFMKGRFMKESFMNYDWLDKKADILTSANSTAFAALSTSEYVYICLAANRPDLLKDCIAYSLRCLGPEGLEELFIRHQCD